MARQETDREDLFAEATVYPFRIELALPWQAEPVFIGFRDDGGAGVYFTQERVFHLTADGLLRRAYLGDALYKAERGRLVRLVRERSPDAVVLRRTDLTDEETAALVTDLANELALLMSNITAGQATQLRSTEDSTNAIARVAGWIDETLPKLGVARSPRA